MIQGLLLAAGRARRFGSHKLLARLPDGEPLGLTAARKLTAVVPVSAVVDPADTAWIECLTAAGIATARCPYARQGMGTSLAWGVSAHANADGWLIMLADMPLVRAQTIARVAEALRAGAVVVAPIHAGRRGHPVGFAREAVGELLALHGDSGARAVIEAYAERVSLLAVDDAGIIADVDTPADLAAVARC